MGGCHDSAIDSASCSKQSFPFLRLPLEIQYQVCCLFCRHCHGQGPAPSPSVTLCKVAGASFTTLKALSETCHALTDLAQPVLYHFPDVKRYTPFFKTVTTNPVLAASVRVLARIYDSDRSWSVSERLENEDFPYLIRLGQQFELCEEADDETAEYWTWDDVNFKRCFECLIEPMDGDQIGYTTDMAFQAYCNLLTALHFSILPRLEFAMIDIYDGKRELRFSLPESGNLLLSYPYLPQVVAAKPEHFIHLRTIIFRQAYHYRQDRLGLERVDFLLPAISNVRVVFFEFLHGEKDEYYQEPEFLALAPAPELGWSALSDLEEVYFDPCAREKEPPLTAIFNMMQRCFRLKKFEYRHKWPDQYDPVLFSPSELLDSIVPVRGTLQHLALYCSSAKIPSFPRDSLLNAKLVEFSSLTTIILDEELFCQHWLSDTNVSEDSCLIHILPKTLSSLTIRLHDKFKAVPDVVRLGNEVLLGGYPRLSCVAVNIIQDIDEPEDPYAGNRNPDAFNSEYLLHGIPSDQWEETLRAFANSTRLAVMKAFQGTKVAIDVRYIHELLFSVTRKVHE